VLQFKGENVKQLLVCGLILESKLNLSIRRTQLFIFTGTQVLYKCWSSLGHINIEDVFNKMKKKKLNNCEDRNRRIPVRAGLLCLCCLLS